MSAIPSANHVRECPYGHGGSQFEQLYVNHDTYARIDPKDEKPGVQRQAISVYRCVVCGGPLFARAPGPELVEIYPQRVPEASKDIPAPAHTIFLEAQRCHGVKAWNATAAMCRRAVQEAVLILGGEGKTLYAQIEDLAKRHIIVDDLKEWAHTIRGIGRDGAHADVLTDISEADADDALKFTEEFLEYNFVLRKRLARRTAKPVQVG